MNRFFTKLQSVKIRDVLSLLLFLPALLCSRFFRLRHPHLWLICESKGEARDNGYWLFKYIREHHPEQEVVYAIDSASADREKVAILGKLIPYGGFTHWVYYLAAEKNISTQKDGKPNAAACYLLEIYGIWKNTRVFLQHGVIINDLKWLYYPETKMRLFVCGAYPEYQFIRDTFGYPEGYVQYLGLCRFDTLHGHQTDPRRILVMPSWREWLTNKIRRSYEFDDIDHFTNTEYFQRWNGFLNDPQLADFLEEQDLEIYFYPHRNMQPYLSEFRTTCPRIRLADWKRYDIQELLKSAAVMVTDYSSVFMDMVYMRKPVLHYQFDEEKFRRGQYPEGYFSYRDGFGPVCTEQAELVAALKDMYGTDGFRMREPYLSRVQEFFPLYDTENCRRNYEAIRDLPGRRTQKAEKGVSA